MGPYLQHPDKTFHHSLPRLAVNHPSPPVLLGAAPILDVYNLAPHNRNVRERQPRLSSLPIPAHHCHLHPMARTCSPQQRRTHWEVHWEVRWETTGQHQGQDMAYLQTLGLEISVEKLSTIVMPRVPRTEHTTEIYLLRVSTPQWLLHILPRPGPQQEKRIVVIPTHQKPHAVKLSRQLLHNNCRRRCRP